MTDRPIPFWRSIIQLPENKPLEFDHSN